MHCCLYTVHCYSTKEGQLVCISATCRSYHEGAQCINSCNDLCVGKEGLCCSVPVCQADKSGVVGSLNGSQHCTVCFWLGLTQARLRRRLAVCSQHVTRAWAMRCCCRRQVVSAGCVLPALHCLCNSCRWWQHQVQALCSLLRARVTYYLAWHDIAATHVVWTPCDQLPRRAFGEFVVSSTRVILLSSLVASCAWWPVVRGCSQATLNVADFRW
jgi:hypothetical protein